MEVQSGVGRHWGAMEVIHLEVDLCRLVEVGAMGVEVIWIVEVGRQRGVIQGVRGRGQEVEVISIVGVTHLVGVIPQVAVPSVVVLRLEVAATHSRLRASLSKARAIDLSIIHPSRRVRRVMIFVPLRTSQI